MKIYLYAALATALVLAPPSPSAAAGAMRAGPRIMMVYGGTLRSPIYLTTFDDNMRLMHAISDTAPPSASVGTRPYVELALFWGNPEWEPYVADTVLRNTLRLRLGSAQLARLYLGDRANPPLVHYAPLDRLGSQTWLRASNLRSVSAEGLKILTRNGVPLYMTVARESASRAAVNSTIVLLIK